MFQKLFSRKTDKASGHQPAPHLIDSGDGAAMALAKRIL